MMIQLHSQYLVNFAGVSGGASLKKAPFPAKSNFFLPTDVFERHSLKPSTNPSQASASIHFGADKTSEITSSLQVAQKMDHIPSALEFRTLANQSGIAAVGNIPEGLETCGLSQQELVQRFDALSNALRYLDGHISNTERSGNGTASVNLPELVLTLGNEKVLLKKGGYGAVGHVYRMQIKGKDYALKVYNDPERLDIHGAWAETGLGTYLSKFQIKNNVPMILANPHPHGGWSLTDWVDPENHAHLSQREGTDLISLLASEGLYMNDLWGPNLGPGGLLWDLGGVLPKAKAPIRTLADFEQLLKNPNTQRSAGRRIGELRGVEANNALFRALADPAVRAQAVIKCASASSPEERNRLFLEAMAYPESRGVAAYDLHKTTPTTQWKVFQKALTYPQAAYEAAKMIDDLPQEKQFQAIMDALNVPEARGMASRHILSLSNDQQKQDALAKALQYPECQIFLNQKLKTPNVPLSASISEYFKGFGLQLEASHP